jgi:hypothetical protein
MNKLLYNFNEADIKLLTVVKVEPQFIPIIKDMYQPSTIQQSQDLVKATIDNVNTGFQTVTQSMYGVLGTDIDTTSPVQTIYTYYELVATNAGLGDLMTKYLRASSELRDTKTFLNSIPYEQVQQLVNVFKDSGLFPNDVPTRGKDILYALGSLFLALSEYISANVRPPPSQSEPIQELSSYFMSLQLATPVNSPREQQQRMSRPSTPLSEEQDVPEPDLF